jgi:uncharacterized protein YndB with AHSA1/START domain
MFTKSILLTAAYLSFFCVEAQNTSKMININENAPVKCSKAIVINATADKVWKVLTDINRWSQWQTEISESKIYGPTVPNTVFNWKTGGAKIQSQIHTVNPFRQFGWTGKAMGMYAIHNWELSEENGTTIVTVEESMEGLVARLLKKSINKNLLKGMIVWLELLKKESEK